MSVYITCFVLLGHVTFGILQHESFPLRYILVAIGFAVAIALRVASGLRGRHHARLTDMGSNGFVKLCKVS